MKYEINNILPDEIKKIIEFLQTLLGTKITDKSNISKMIYREKSEHCCPYCKLQNIVKNGHSEKNVQIYKCKNCL